MVHRIHFIVSGRVQGVGFRYHTQKKATSLGLVGWVRNLSEGTVEVEAEGDEEPLNDFLDWCRRGPPAASVTNVEVLSRGAVPASPSGKQFEIR